MANSSELDLFHWSLLFAYHDGVVDSNVDVLAWRRVNGEHNDELRKERICMRYRERVNEGK